MSTVTHHIPDEILAAYSAGTLPHAFAVVVAAHVSLCDQCRVALAAHEAVGGVVLDDSETVAVSSTLKEDIFALLDAPAPAPEPTFVRTGIYPGPVMQALKGRPIKWRNLGMGVRQDILTEDTHGSVRLLYIPPGQAVPDHSHNGLEMTLVLQGSFSDETGHFGVGDVEIADESLEHTPTAGLDAACICLAATDARLRFRSLIPRLLQPVFRI